MRVLLLCAVFVSFLSVVQLTGLVYAVWSGEDWGRMVLPSIITWLCCGFCVGLYLDARADK